MGLIHIDVFSTLDGVAQAPGGPDEDREGGFEFGGWQAPHLDEVAGQSVVDNMQGMDALLLGRKTYDIFANYWPHQESGGDAGIATLFNRIPKYVASRSHPTLDWAHSTLLGPDLVADVRALRDRHEHIHVIGSLDFCQTLLEERLFDVLTLWIHPVLLGPGKKIFADGVVPANLRLLEPAVTSPKGTLVLHYALAEGIPATGDMSQPDRDRG